MMRRYAVDRPYERLKELTRGHRIGPEALKVFIDGLEIPEGAKAELKALTPATYLGEAPRLAREI
jgi:adenylosuccinate lyase